MNHFPLTRVPSVEIVFLTPVRNVDVSEVFPLQLPSAQGKGCQGCHGHQSSGRWCYCISTIRALIVSLFNRSELDCLFVSLAGAWLEPGHQMVVQGRGESLPSFILPVIRTQACPALLVVMVSVIVPKLTIIFVAGTIFARVNSCDVRTYRHSLCLLELESTENISS